MDRTPLKVERPTEDWHVLCGWLESMYRDHRYMPIAAIELMRQLRDEHFKVEAQKEQDHGKGIK